MKNTYIVKIKDTGAITAQDTFEAIIEDTTTDELPTKLTDLIAGYTEALDTDTNSIQILSINLLR